MANGSPIGLSPSKSIFIYPTRSAREELNCGKVPIAAIRQPHVMDLCRLISFATKPYQSLSPINFVFVELDEDNTSSQQASFRFQPRTTGSPDSEGRVNVELTFGIRSRVRPTISLRGQTLNKQTNFRR